MKRKLYFWAQKNINSDNVRFIVLLVPLSVILIRSIIQGDFSLSGFLDTDVLISFVLIALCDVIAQFILKHVQKKCEDSAKLTQDYPKLIKKYSSDKLITYKGNRFPVTCLFLRNSENPWKIEINDSPEHRYELPSQVADLSAEIMTAHEQSVLYNQINIRLENVDFQPQDNTLTLHTGRTFYFDSMLTNRACDYELSNGKTIREIYEPGPYLLPLNQSRMSNHLGYNGFIMTSDGKIPFVMRGDNLSIGKNTLANSIGASLKTKYAITPDSNYCMTPESLGRSILLEIADELSLCSAEQADAYFAENGISHLTATNSIIAVYRDLVECGKPQFLFYLKFDFIDSLELEKRFNKKNKIKPSDAEDKVIRDGKQLIFFTLDQLKQATITADKLTVAIDGVEKHYTMMPSASASIVMMLAAISK